MTTPPKNGVVSFYLTFFLFATVASPNIHLYYYIYEWCNLFHWLYNNYTSQVADLCPSHLKIIIMALVTILIVLVVVDVIFWLINNHVRTDRKSVSILNRHLFSHVENWNHLQIKLRKMKRFTYPGFIIALVLGTAFLIVSIILLFSYPGWVLKTIKNKNWL